VIEVVSVSVDFERCDFNLGTVIQKSKWLIPAIDSVVEQREYHVSLPSIAFQSH